MRGAFCPDERPASWRQLADPFRVHTESRPIRKAALKLTVAAPLVLQAQMEEFTSCACVRSDCI